MRIVERMGSEAIGWFSSFVLVLTISNQVYNQWRSGTSQGVSRWLFVGQLTASTGFTLYSVMVGNWVFVVTNALMVVSALLGLFIVMKHRRAERRRPRHAAVPRGRAPRGPEPPPGSPAVGTSGDGVGRDAPLSAVRAGAGRWGWPWGPVRADWRGP